MQISASTIQRFHESLSEPKLVFSIDELVLHSYTICFSFSTNFNSVKTSFFPLITPYSRAKVASETNPQPTNWSFEKMHFTFKSQPIIYNCCLHTCVHAHVHEYACVDRVYYL